MYLCLQEQMRLHPAMQPQDVLKLCYQAAHGAEHLLTDADRAREYFDREFAAVPADASIPLAEDISDTITRINLGAWKAAALPPEWLFRIFAHTANAPADSAPLADCLAEATILCAPAMPGWDAALSAWQDAGMPPVHHSEAYRAAERPAYRIVHRSDRALLPILMQLAAQPALRTICITPSAHSADLSARLADVLGNTYRITADATAPDALHIDAASVDASSSACYPVRRR